MKDNDQGERQFTMTMIQPSKVFLRTLLLGSALACVSTQASAQSSSVMVDLSAIDAPQPKAANGRITLRPPMGTAPVSSSSGAVMLRVPEPVKKVSPKPKPAIVAETPAVPVASPVPTPAPIKAAEPVPQKAPSPAAPTQTAAAASAPAPMPKETKPAAPITPPAAAVVTPKAPAVAAPATPAPTTVAAAPQKPAAPPPAAAAPAVQPATSTPMTPPVATPPSAAAARSAKQEPVGPVAAAMPENQQTAALPPAAKAKVPSATAEEVTVALTIPFAPGVTDIDVSRQGSVKDLAQSMSSDKSLRVQLMAYATDPEKNTSKARRLALDRAIAIRNMLIEAGVERTRIEVRALGDQGEGGNLDRVDAVAIKR